MERCLTLARIVSSSCAGARLPTRPRVAVESFVFGRTRCTGIGAVGFGLVSVCLCSGGCAGRTLSAEEVCWGFCIHFNFACNSLQNKISCGTKKILLAIAYLGFSNTLKDFAGVLYPVFCLAQPQWQSLDVQGCLNGWDKSRQARV